MERIKNMNERIKELRKYLMLNQEEFGKQIGVKKSAISLIESGKNNVTERMLLSICLVFDVNEQWLRDGIGEMFIDKNSNQLIAKFLGDLLVEPNSFRKKLITGMAKLNSSEWDEFEKIITKIMSTEENSN